MTLPLGTDIRERVMSVVDWQACMDQIYEPRDARRGEQRGWPLSLRRPKTRADGERPPHTVQAYGEIHYPEGVLWALLGRPSETNSHLSWSYWADVGPNGLDFIRLCSYLVSVIGGEWKRGNFLNILMGLKGKYIYKQLFLPPYSFPKVLSLF